VACACFITDQENYTLFALHHLLLCTCFMTVDRASCEWRGPLEDCT
jgi:hypothetical protein